MDKIIGIGVVGFLVWVVLSSVSGPPSSIEGKVPVEYKPTKLNLDWKKPTDGAGTLEVRSRGTDALLGSYVMDDDGVLHEDPEQQRSGQLSVTYQPDSHAGKWNLDVGGWAGYSLGTREPEVGLRLSPARVLFGTVAPDLAVSNDSIGIGLSIFTPERSLPSPWRHIGIGGWYAAPFDRDQPAGFVFGISTSITH